MPATLAPPVPTSSTPCPSRQVGRFAVSEEIARGGMGAVLRGHDDQLRREVAVKVLLDEHAGKPELLHRFIEEAQIAGQLQHPGVVPVYEMGRLEDRRPYFAMKLVKGQTLAALLAARKDPSEDLPRFLGIFEQVCQAVAYAHSKRVLHRDLKPANIMVGAFGEVQVMDWGLAKVLRDGSASAAQTPRAPAVSAIRTVRSDPTAQPGDNDAPLAGQTAAGSILGTAAYMSPEQAAGQVDSLDERCDVFGLGAILCEILTGKPPYVASEEWRLLYMAGLGQLEEAYSRLNASGADAELVRLVRDCLHPDAASRPRDASAVARRVAEYQQGVQDRLRQAERERAAAQAREEEAKATARAEQRARRQALALAAAVLLLVVGGGGGAWLFQQQRLARQAEIARRRNEADAAAGQAMAKARLLLAQAQAAAPADAGKFHEAAAAARQAEEVSRTGGASEDVQSQAAELAQAVAAEERQAARDRELLAALLQVRGPSEGPKYRRDDRGQMLQLAEPSAQEQFAAAFRAWGLDVDATPGAEAAQQLRGRPAAVVREIVAGLDEWALERRRQHLPEASWRRLAALAAALDTDRASGTRSLRAMLESGGLARERAVGLLSAALRPVPIPYDAGAGPQRSRLRQLAGQLDVVTAPALELLMVGRALQEAGDERLAEELLRNAVHARPAEVVLYHALGQLLRQRGDWSGAVECYAAARALRPGLGGPLAEALVGAGRVGEGLALYQRLLAEQAQNPWLHFQRGNALYDDRRYKEAEASYRKAIRIKPDDPEAHVNLGNALVLQGRYKEAEAEYRAALRLKPDDPEAHVNLGSALKLQGRYKEAEAEYRAALRLKLDGPEVHNVLGKALEHQGRYKEAEAEYREALRLKPDYPEAHVNLGVALGLQGRHKEAEAECREALRLKPDYPEAHGNLGVALMRQGRYKEAEAECRAAIRLKPDYPEAHFNLGVALTAQGRYKEAEAECRAALRLKPDFPVAHYNLGSALMRQGRYKEAEAECREALRLKHDDPEAHITLGNALTAQGRYKEAEAEYREALRLKPDFPDAHYGLGIILNDQHRYREMEAECREALRLKPDYPEAHITLGIALTAQGRYKEAEAEYRAALRLKPDFPEAHVNLGSALEHQGRHKEAEAEYREALRLKPDDPEAHVNLGIALTAQDRYKEAEAEYREALRLKPDDPEAHVNLGIALGLQGRHKEAEAEYRVALRLNPDDPESHITLGNALTAQSQYKEAEAEYRTAVRLNADNHRAHVNLGWALWHQGRYKEAEAESRAALRLKPDDPESHFSLGSALNVQGRYREAEPEFRATLRLKPDYPEAHHNLGSALKGQGLFAEALQANRRAHALGSQVPGWRYPSAEWVRQCERLVELDSKLAAVLKGQAQPAGPAERLDLANLCQHPSKRLYATAARLYAEAFATGLKRTEDLTAPSRYNAACAAALAAAGQGNDAAGLDAQQRARWRGQALAWLQSDLRLYRKQLRDGKPQQRAAVPPTLRHWQQDSDLAGVRDEKALAGLPADERAAWKKLWADVAELARKAEGKK